MDTIYDVRLPIINYWFRTPYGKLKRADWLQDVLNIAGNEPYALCDDDVMWAVSDNIVKLLQELVKYKILNISNLENKFIDEFCFGDWNFYPTTESTKSLMLNYKKNTQRLCCELPTFKIENGYANLTE